jgi:ubiquinone/menaquinone biosynthesis C-methylase UbiE
MPFRASTFDAVVGSSILHHLDIIPALREINRVLKDCGRISFAEPNMMNPQIMLQKNIPLLKKFLGDSPDETAFFRWRLYELLKKEGFSEINITPFDFLHPMTPTSLIGLVNRTGMFLEKTPLLKEISGSLIISAVKLI